MKFMLMMHAPRTTGDWAVASWSPEDLKRHIQFMIALNGELKASGELVAAEGLDMPMAARIVRAGANGEPLVTDGPYAEGKEFLAGFWIIDVDSVERAHAIAAKASAAPGQNGVPMNMPIEFRAVGSPPPID